MRAHVEGGAQIGAGLRRVSQFLYLEQQPNLALALEAHQEPCSSASAAPASPTRISSAACARRAAAHRAPISLVPHVQSLPRGQRPSLSARQPQLLAEGKN